MVIYLVLLIASYLFYYFTGNIVLMLGMLTFGTLVILWGGQIMLINSFHEVEQAKGNIEDGFQKRHDALIKVIDTLKSEMSKRDETLNQMIKIAEEKRSAPKGILGQKTQGEYEHWYQDTRKEIIRFTQKHDEMNKDSHRVLIQTIIEVEDNLSAARRFYNHSVKKYNSSLHSFPGNLIGKFKGFSAEEYFKVENETIRQDVKIKL